MNKIYLVILNKYHDVQTTLVDICTTKEKAEELQCKYERNAAINNMKNYQYFIEEIDLTKKREVIWNYDE